MNRCEADLKSSTDLVVKRAIDAQCAGHLEDAASLYRHALEQMSDHPAAHHFFGILKYQTGETDAGLAMVNRSVQLSPNRADWLNDLGNLLAASGRNEDAANAFMSALELDQGNAPIWNNLGAVLQRLGQLDEAGFSFQTALSLNPNFEDALNNLGHIQSQQGKPTEAARSYCAAYVARPGADKSPHMLGIAYYVLGRIDEAAETYRAWLRQQPGHPIASHMLAACTGENVPERASDAYLEMYFDRAADQFDSKMVGMLAYQVPERAGQAIAGLGLSEKAVSILDAGCGTGLCAPYLKPFAKQLTGVDLSANSLAAAAEKGLYDQLVKQEMVDYLRASGQRFDMIVSLDTFIYFGNLAPLLEAFSSSITDDGLLVVSAEALLSGEDSFELTPSGRYCHRREHVLAQMTAAGFKCESVAPLKIRIELGEPVDGMLFVARKVASC